MEFFTGQIIPIAIGYAPRQTAMCQGQLLPVNQNQALFSLLGITYGGNGQTTFGLPNVQGRTLIGQNAPGGLTIGTIGGETDHVLTLGEIPAHTHSLNAVTGGTQTSTAAGNMMGTSNVATYATPSTPPIGLAVAPLSTTGAGQSHTNMQPSAAINFTIVLYGIYPSRA